MEPEKKQTKVFENCRRTELVPCRWRLVVRERALTTVLSAEAGMAKVFRTLGCLQHYQVYQSSHDALQGSQRLKAQNTARTAQQQQQQQHHSTHLFLRARTDDHQHGGKDRREEDDTSRSAVHLCPFNVSPPQQTAFHTVLS